MQYGYRGIARNIIVLCLVVIFLNVALAEHSAAAYLDKNTWTLEKEMPAQGAEKKTVSFRLQSLWSREIRLFFDEPMVSGKQVGTKLSAADVPFTVAPSTKLEGKWIDTQTLELLFVDSFLPATKYTFTPKDNFTSVTGAMVNKVYSLIPHPLQINEFRQVSYDKNGVIKYFISVGNGIVSAEDLQRHLHLSLKGGGDLTGVTVSAYPQRKDAFYVSFTVPLGSTVNAVISKELMPQKGSVGLVKEYFRALSPSSMLEVRKAEGSYLEKAPWSRVIRITTSAPVRPETLKKFITVGNAKNFYISMKDETTFLVRGDFAPQQQVDVVIHKGMPRSDGRGMLAEDSKNRVFFDNPRPALALGEQGTLASPGSSLLVPLNSINVNRVGFTLREVPEASVSLIGTYMYNSYRSDLAPTVATSTAAIALQQNMVVEQSINLEDMTKGKKGVFILSAENIDGMDGWSGSYLSSSESDSNRSRVTGSSTSEGDGYYGEYYDGDYYDNDRQKSQKVVIVSDIGLVARVRSTGITVWANSLAKAESLSGVTLRVFSRDNVLLAEGKTDSAGLWQHDLGGEWPTNQYPYIVVASTSFKGETKQEKGKPFVAPRSFEDLTYLTLAKDFVQDNRFDVGGKEYLQSGYEALCFTPRDVFRPGETVPMRAVVRDNLMQAPKPFPVEWKVITPTGRTAGKGFATLTETGLAEFDFTLVPAAPTGNYRLELSVPGQGAIGNHSFKVEELQPPRLDVTLVAQTPFALKGQEFSLHLGAMYLFGAPAANVNYEGLLSLRPKTFAPTQWRDYTFGYGAADRALEDIKVTGSLDEKGNAELKGTFESRVLAGAYNVHATLQVQEDGGRFVNKTMSFPLFGEPVQFGYKAPAQSYLAGSASVLEVCAITPDEKPVNGDVNYSIALARSYYYWVDADYASDVDYEPLKTGTATLRDGKTTVSFTAPEDGNYVLVMEDPTTNSKRAIPFEVRPSLVGSSGEASPIGDKVFLTWDKKSYDIGDTAKLFVKAPFTGRMLLVLENNQERMVKVIDLKKTETVIPIPVEEEYGPNAYVSVSVIRPMEKDTKWQVGRAMGIAPLLIEKTSAKLNVTIAAPERILPMSNVAVSVTLTDAKGKPVQGEVSLSFVDEGLLAYTRYTMPKPYEFFSAKRALRTGLYDRYDDLIPFTDKKALLLKAGGGDSGYDDGGRLSVVLRKVELFTVAHQVVKTDAKGVANVTLAVPEYSGKGRLIAVAATKKSAGSADKQVNILRDITIEATAPRMVAPGDTFDVPVLAFADAKAKGTAKVVVSTTGPLQVQGSTDFTVDLTNQKKQTLTVPFIALPQMGTGVITITTTIGTDVAGAFTQKIEVPVRPPFPRETVKAVGTASKANPASITFPSGFYPGSQKLTLAFSETPEVGLASALEYLQSYPYGCLEQTTSTTWPYIGVPMLLKRLAPEMADNTTYQKALDYGVRRMLAMQRPDGGFVTWPGDNVYRGNAYSWGTVYALHLLTELRNSGSTLVPADAITAGTSWMRRELSRELPNEKDSYNFGVRAYIAYVLALQGEPPLGWMGSLKDNAGKLNVSGKIFLAGAYALAEGKSAPLKDLGTAVYTSSHYGWSYESAVRNESLRLLMWAQVDPYAPQTALLAKRVMELGAKDQWRSTQENAMATLALGKYMEKTSKAQGPFTATVKANKNGTAAVTLAEFKQGETPVLTTEALLPQGEKVASPVTVTVEPEKAEQDATVVYYSMVAQGVPVQEPQATANGITLMRRWTLPNGSQVDSFTVGPKGVITSQPANITVEQGDVIDVTLFIRGDNPVTSIVLTDIVPGGFEIEQPNLKNSYDNEDDEGQSGLDIEKALKHEFALKDKNTPLGKYAQLLNATYGVRADVRDDRLLLYVDSLRSESVFTYKLRAVNKGTFVLPPAHIEGMYETDINSLTPTGKVKIVAKPAAQK